MNLTSSPSPGHIEYPAGFGARRGLNWFTVGLMYASFYMCRYNFRHAWPEIRTEFHLDVADYGYILGAWSWAYGVGQLVNGLFTDRIGGKRAMLLGAAGMIFANLLFGASSAFGGFTTFTLIWVVNGYMQAFGAPGMVKINAAWFPRSERGTFAGIFGFMIQLGQVIINNLAPALLAGFTLALWTVPKLPWKWLFWVPPALATVVAVMVMLFVKETPKAAGYADALPELGDRHDTVRISLKESFFTIIRHPLVWFYAVAYACTGAVRHGADQYTVLYFIDHLGLDREAPAMVFTLDAMPIVAVLGSFASGWISDRLLKGHRSPIAMTLYFLETGVILLAVVMIEMLGVKGIYLSCFFLVMISLTANSTHSIVGTAAPMDIGGPRMAGFAAGVIDSFQYFGSGVALPLMGHLLKAYGWGTWFPAMAGFGFIGGLAMLMVMRKQQRLQQQEIGVAR
jgi:OPA family glycerol-3-phosphate transporter-like MFS transporter